MNKRLESPKYSSQFLRRAVVLMVMLFGSPLLSLAQSQYEFDEGMRPFAAYNAGNVDSINLSSGALSVTIPLISYPQRGGKLKLELALQYNSGWSNAMYGCIQFSPSTGACVTEGLTVNGRQTQFNLVDRQQMDTVFTQQFEEAGGYGITVYSDALVSSDGAVHPMAAANSTGSLYRSTDATGFSGGSGSTTDPSGIAYTSGSCPLSPAQPSTGELITLCNYSRTDPNSNSTSFTQSSGWIDSLGRTIPLPTQSSAPANFTGCSSGANGTYPTAYVELWNPPGIGNGQYPIKFCYFTQTFSYTYPPVPGYTPSGPLTFTMSELQNVVLPNGTAWTFLYAVDTQAYMAHLNLTQIIFPSGGAISYGWTTTSTAGACSNDPTGLVYETDAVATRTLNPADGVTPAGTWTYTYGPPSQGVTTVQNPDGSQVVHTFGVEEPPGTSDACYPWENQATYYGVNGAVLKTVNTTYSYLPSGLISAWSKAGTVAMDVVPATVTTIWQNGQQRQTKYSYDSGSFNLYGCFSDEYGSFCTQQQNVTGIYGSLLEQWEYDYGNGAPGSLLRTTTNTYLALNNSNYLSANLLNLPSSVQVTGAGPGSLTNYSYDQSNGSPQGVHGNLTSTSRWLNTTNTYLTTSNVYNSNGLVTSTVDPKGNTTTYGYTSPCYAGSGPTSVTNALGQTTNHCYDADTGLLTSTTDSNSQTTTYAYDEMLRTTQITYPKQTLADGQSLYGVTTFTYPNPTEVQISELMDDQSHYRNSTLLVDGVGREIRQAVTNGETTPYDEVDTCYDGNGRVSFKGSPFQDTGPFTTSRNCGSSEAGDTFAYDGLDRTTSVTHSDGSSLLTSYTGRATNVQDEGNGTQPVQRVSQVDGLGRLASVCEVTSTTLSVGISGSTTPAACGQDIAATGFFTSYAYDTLNDLTSVTQGPLNGRSFVYDSLSRLTSATNPESGTTNYTYDADGNVLTKEDARDTTITYAYDALNRLTGKAYSDTTPAVTYNYDQTSAMGITLTNTKGRLSSESTAGSNPTGSVFSYDPMGRVLNNSQCTPQNCSGTPFSLAYTYDLLGDITSSTNGAGVTLTNSYNLGARLTSVSSSLSGSNQPGTLFGYQNIAHYNAAGSILSVTLGNAVNETRAYDARLRLCSIIDGSVYTLSIPSTASVSCPSGSVNGYAPDGDILAANDSVNGNWTYSYDPLNRLIGSSQNSGTATYSYAYDRFGNRWQQNVTNGSGSSSSLGFNANNQITGVTGVTYDAAGDTTDDGVTTYTFDAEGRIVTAANNWNGTSTYIYDAAGQRIRKVTVAGGTVDFVYDLAGHEIAQFNTSGVWTRGEVYAGGRHVATYSGGTGGTTYFIHADWLGTERVRSNSSGSSYETCTSLPFGDGLSCTTADVSPMHFSGKERDTETASTPGGANGLDNFGARYDSSSMGRFITPDWSASIQNVPYAKFDDPQSLDLYAYARNNPITLLDPDGHCWSGWFANLFCKAGQRFDNLFHGFGFRTDKGVEDLHHEAALFLRRQGVNIEGLGFAAVIKTYQTYRKLNSQTGQVYSGRTSGTGTPEDNLRRRDQNHHMNEEGYGPAELDQSSENADAIRGREQQLINQNGGAQSQGGTSGNAINGVSPTNPNAAAYEAAANAEFGPEGGGGAEGPGLIYWIMAMEGLATKENGGVP